MFTAALALTAAHPSRAAQLQGIQNEIRFRLALADKAATAKDRKFQIAMARANVRSANMVAAMMYSPEEARAFFC